MSESVDAEYHAEQKKRESKICEERWRLSIKFHRRLLRHTSQGASFTVHGSVKDLCGSFYKLEKRRFVSRPNFHHCLQTHGLWHTNAKPSAHPTKSSDPLANALYDAFDSTNQNTFDWRVFTFFLHVVAEPNNLDPPLYLKLAFRYFVGHGELLHVDAPSSHGVRLHGLGAVLGPAIRPDRLEELLGGLDDAWSEGCGVGGGGSVRMDAGRLVRAVDYDRERGIEISYRCFGQMVDRLDLCRRFGTVVGKGVGMFEERYYPVTLLRYRKLVWTIRESILTFTTRTKYNSFARWRQTAVRRRILRDFMTRISDQITRQALSAAMVLITRFAMESVARHDIQRVTRGFLGRVGAKVKQITLSSVIHIQSNARGFIQKKRFALFILRRTRAAIDAQRCIRGYLGKLLTLKKLLTSIDKNRMQVAYEHEMRYLHHMSTSSIIIQRHFRAWLSLRRLREGIDKKMRENEVIKRIQEYESKHATKRKIYQEQLSKHYDCIRQESHEQNILSDKYSEQRVKIKDLHRKISCDQHQEDENEKTRRDLQYNNSQRQEIIDDWEQKEEGKCNSYKDYCIQCLRKFDTPAEKRFGRQIRKRIKKRVVDVLRRADSNQMKMEHPEALMIAEKETIHMMGQEERGRIRQELAEVLDNLETKQSQEAAEKKKKKRDRKMKDATLIICFAIRRWRARAAMHSKSLDVYEKIFDVTHQAFYYKNKKTGDVSWQKPKSLGKLDIEPKDEWILLKNDRELTYYYNPLRMEMSWKPPSSTQLEEL